MTDSQRSDSDKDPSSNARRSQSDDRPKGPGKPGEPRPPMNSPEEKATQFDGNPNPGTDESPRLFKPRDDTPGFLEKKSGPKN